MAQFHAKKHVSGLSPFVLALAIATPSYADLGEEVKTYGNWTVRRSVDAMTDQVSCLATSTDNAGVQLYDTVLYIGARGPQGFKYRLDDAAPSELQLVRDNLRRVGAIAFEDALFNQVLQADRLRIQIVTYSALENIDLDLCGIRSAHELIVSSDACQ